MSQPNLPALPCRPGTGPGQEDICQWEPSDGSDPLLAGGAGEFASDASFLALLGEGLLSLGLGAVEPDTYPCPMGFLSQRSCPGCPAAVVLFPPLRWEVSHKLRINHKKGKGFLSVPLPIIPLGYTPSGQGWFGHMHLLCTHPVLSAGCALFWEAQHHRKCCDNLLPPGLCHCQPGLPGTRMGLGPQLQVPTGTGERGCAEMLGRHPSLHSSICDSPAIPVPEIYDEMVGRDAEYPSPGQ